MAYFSLNALKVSVDFLNKKLIKHSSEYSLSIRIIPYRHVILSRKKGALEAKEFINFSQMPLAEALNNITQRLETVEPNIDFKSRY